MTRMTWSAVMQSAIARKCASSRLSRAVHHEIATFFDQAQEIFQASGHPDSESRLEDS